jgi:hypothetical protein
MAGKTKMIALHFPANPAKNGLINYFFFVMKIYYIHK